MPSGGGAFRSSPALRSPWLFFYYYFMVPESELWHSASKSAQPLREIFTGSNLVRLGQLLVVMSGAALAVPLFPLIRTLSQRIGRRPMIVILGLVNAVPVALYYILVGGAFRDPARLVQLIAAIVVLSMPVWAVITPYITESFRTEIRSTGYGVSYSLATILPGFYSFYMLAMAKVVPYEYTPVVLLALGGLLLIIGAAAGSETRHVDLH